MFKSKYFEQDVKNGGDPLVFELVFFVVIGRNYEHDVDQVILCHFLNLHRKKFVLILFVSCFACSQRIVDSLHVVGASSFKHDFQVV